MKNKNNQKKILAWLKENTRDKAGARLKASFEIARGTGIGEAKVMHLCTIHKDIYIKKVDDGSLKWACIKTIVFMKKEG